MFEAYKKTSILQFAPFLVSQLLLEDDGSDATKISSPDTEVRYFCTILGHP